MSEPPKSPSGAEAIAAAARSADGDRGDQEPESGAAHELQAFQAESHHTRKMKEMEVGWLGRLFGSGDEKVGNIVGFVVAVAFLFLAIEILVDGNAEIKTSLIGLISLGLGYLFGSRR